MAGSDAGDVGGTVFQQLEAGAAEAGLAEIESLCMNCGENGVTRLFPTRIPFFREVVIMSFECHHCGFSNNELQSAGKVQEQGCRYTITITSKKELDRQVVRMDTASVHIPHLQFEIPANSQKGALTTIEGIIDRSVEGLRQDQGRREPLLAQKLAGVIEKLTELKDVRQPWILTVNDPSGNSFIENACAPNSDPHLEVYRYKRTVEQNRLLGFVDDADEDAADDTITPSDVQNIGKDEVLMFNDMCSNCSAPLQTKMKVVDIPNFKSVIIMASQCEVCGNKATEVKGGSGVEPQGLRITLRIADVTDFSRDVVKSETCQVRIPRLGFEHDTSVMGGKFTTVEGLLTDIKTELVDRNPFICGDSSQAELHTKLKLFGGEIDKILSGDYTDVTLVLDDPAGNSYVQSLGVDDDRLVIENYTRSQAQDDELGLTHMNTDTYTAEPS